MDEKIRLTAISLLDGRNWDKVKIVSEYFSEFALMKYRLRIEILYLLSLSARTGIIRKFTKKEIEFLSSIFKDFSLDDALAIKSYEKKINHDVKAVEYFIRSKLLDSTAKDISEFIHFGLTSYDINIPAYALMIKDFTGDILFPKLNAVTNALSLLSKNTKSMVMLAKTHGQPALPTTMGKEMAVFLHRLNKEIAKAGKVRLEGKLNGAVGNFNALAFAAPKVNWRAFSKEFISSLGLDPNSITTQILPYDSWLELFDGLKRINAILLGLSQDIWWYISFEYFLQKKKNEEVGSSTMSHKINPITFENAEGNFGLANALFEFFTRKLSYSRLQRDLSDSTVKRDFGLAFGFTLLALDSLLSGLSKISPNPGKMKTDLDAHWETYSEGIQTYLRMKGFTGAYEALKDQTRGKVMNKENMYALIESLPISRSDKKKLKIEDLSQYLGLAAALVTEAAK